MQSKKPSANRAPGRPRRACDRCNAQKIRCTGGPPSCDRCMRLCRPCSYGEADPQARVQVATPVSDVGRRTPDHDPNRIVDSRGAYYGIPQALVFELVEIYFSHAYNAALLLHKQSFVQSLRSETANHHVLLSVCAFASRCAVLLLEYIRLPMLTRLDSIATTPETTS